MKRTENKFPAAVPLMLGILSALTVAIYFYSANHALYQYTDVLAAGPVLSLLGIVISVVTRKQRRRRPALWISGLVVCAVSFVVCVLTFLLLIGIANAMLHGTW